MSKIIAHEEDKKINFTEVYDELKAMMNEIGAEPELWLRGFSVVFVSKLPLNATEINAYKKILRDRKEKNERLACKNHGSS